MKEKKKTEAKMKKGTESAVALNSIECRDVKCPIHGNLKVRGRAFEGKVIKKFPKRISIELEKTVYVRKYERYAKSRTRIHARLPDCMENMVSVGDLIRVQECRPLSKIIHSVVTNVIKKNENNKEIGK